MKKTLFICTSFALFLITSCGHKPGDMLVGKWQATDIKIDDSFLNKQLKDQMGDMGASLPQQQMDSIMNAAKAEAQKSATDGAKTTSMEFKSDGTTTFNTASDSGSGKFTMSDDSKTITIDDGSRKMSCSVISMTDKQLVIDMDSMMTITMTKQ